MTHYAMRPAAAMREAYKPDGSAMWASSGYLTALRCAGAVAVRMSAQKAITSAFVPSSQRSSSRHQRPIPTPATRSTPTPFLSRLRSGDVDFVLPYVHVTADDAVAEIDALRDVHRWSRPQFGGTDVIGRGGLNADCLLR